MMGPGHWQPEHELESAASLMRSPSSRRRGQFPITSTIVVLHGTGTVHSRRNAIRRGLGETQSMKGRVNVHVRIRSQAGPKVVTADETQCVIRVQPQSSVFEPTRSYKFDSVSGETATQAGIFEAIGLPALHDVLQGTWTPLLKRPPFAGNLSW